MSRPHFRSPDRNVLYLDPRDGKLPSLNVIFMTARRRMRSRQLLLVIGVLIFAAFSLYTLRQPAISIARGTTTTDTITKLPSGPEAPASEAEGTPAYHVGSSHPIWQLIKDAEKDFEKKKAAQSKTLDEAVAEYRRRYGIPPPPNFDKWYKFAVAKGIQLIDEYDSIHQSLTPFWALKPVTIRKRAQEALGFGNNLIGLMIRSGQSKKIQGGGEWQREATTGMIKEFVKYLPDMDIAFNIHDEPRVVVPHDDLSRLVKNAKEVAMPAANAVPAPRNTWSQRPKDMNDGSRIDEVKVTRFNVFAHQPTWTHSRISCSPDSPARTLEDGEKEDNFDSYAVGELGFVYNQTAFSDICQSPSFSQTFGFFDRPNAFNVVHDLFPIFSQSKISSFSDILYPSPWYWYGKVPYNDKEDYEWTEKKDRFYWRGSTTGGFSRDGGWRRQHRQRLVQKINAVDQAKILTNTGTDEKEVWEVKSAPRSDFREIMDIFFSYVGQCDPGDCDAQKQFFDIKEQAKQQDAWKYKYLLDIDGNAFSGRFYAFLKSKSLVYKLAVFREWHEEWLKPWVHYIPLSLRGDEWVEAVRWFAGETPGKKEAERIALQGRDWANKVLRNEDLEVWFFRLLLEYGRLVDDDREIIGYSSASAS
ncbi:capsule-associated protein [Phlyctema vagabunda]|uniref:Capsule-associated protein n=1 Tax=Phlyctema vagabunda TaxID=108571 RepID=A0ABR4PUN3_9HELO